MHLLVTLNNILYFVLQIIITELKISSGSSNFATFLLITRKITKSLKNKISYNMFVVHVHVVKYYKKMVEDIYI